MKIGIVGGGASGFFCAIRIKEKHPAYDVTILEGSSKVLSKVKISGGGRCNVTNIEPELKVLAENYPRGKNKLKKLFGKFSNKDMITWLNNKGIQLREYDNGCLFPVSNDSQTIIDCFLNECQNHCIKIKTYFKVKKVNLNTSFEVENISGESLHFDKLVIATGGHPKKQGFSWIEELGVEIIEPKPSLFTFNMPNEKTADIMGIVEENVQAKIPGTKLSAEGPLLFTHWGMSGPAILKLSAWGARILSDMNYNFEVMIKWCPALSEEDVRKVISNHMAQAPKTLLKNKNPFQLKNRLWEYLLTRRGINIEKTWNELGKKEMNLMISIIIADTYKVSGKTTFKEEFVTAGGVALSEVNSKTLESAKVTNLFFCGEVLDIDGITGGYNFQAAWTTADTVASSIVVNR